MSDITIFDKILAGEIPCQKVFENEDVFAFEDVNPQAPIHVLVIPKKKVVGFADLKNESPDLLASYMAGISLVAEKLGLDEDGYRVVFNQGSDGGQTVSYIHAHILGGRQLNWPPG